MNDEEKKAIDMCRLLLNGDITLHVIDDDGGIAYVGTVNKTYNDDLQTVLNLIEKQQKEIEELKEINKEHQLLNRELGFKIGILESEIEELKSNKKVFANINIELDDMKEYIDGAINNILIENYIPKQKNNR